MRTKVSGLILPSQSSEKPTALPGTSLNDPTLEKIAENQKHFFANHIRRDVDAFKMTFMSLEKEMFRIKY